jgi:hypothetical protein
MVLIDENYIKVASDQFPEGTSNTFKRFDTSSKWMKVSSDDGPCFIIEQTGLYQIHMNLSANGREPSNIAFGFTDQRNIWVIRDMVLLLSYPSPDPLSYTLNVNFDWVGRIQGGTQLFLWVTWGNIDGTPSYLINNDLTGDDNIHAYRLM